MEMIQLEESEKDNPSNFEPINPINIWNFPKENPDSYESDTILVKNNFGYLVNLILSVVWIFVALYMSIHLWKGPDEYSPPIVLDDTKLFLTLISSVLFIIFHVSILFKKTDELNLAFFSRIFNSCSLVLGTFLYFLVVLSVYIKYSLKDGFFTSQNICLLIASSVIPFTLCTVFLSEYKFNSWKNHFKPWILTEKQSLEHCDDTDEIEISCGVIGFVLEIVLLLIWIIFYYSTIACLYSNDEHYNAIFNVSLLSGNLGSLLIIASHLKSLSSSNHDNVSFEEPETWTYSLKKSFPAIVGGILVFTGFTVIDIFLYINSAKSGSDYQMVFIIASFFLLSYIISLSLLLTSNKSESFVRFFKPWYVYRKSK